MSAGDHGGQKMALDLLDLEVAGGYEPAYDTPGLGTELWSFARIVSSHPSL